MYLPTDLFTSSNLQAHSVPLASQTQKKLDRLPLPSNVIETHMVSYLDTESSLNLALASRTLTHPTIQGYRQTETTKIESWLDYCLQKLESIKQANLQSILDFQKKADKSLEEVQNFNRFFKENAHITLKIIQLEDLKSKLSQRVVSCHLTCTQKVLQKIGSFILGKDIFAQPQGTIPQAVSFMHTKDFVSTVKNEIAEILSGLDKKTIELLKKDFKDSDTSLFELMAFYQLNLSILIPAGICIRYLNLSHCDETILINDLLKFCQNPFVHQKRELLMQVCKALCLTGKKDAISYAIHLVRHLYSDFLGIDGQASALKEICEIWMTLNPDLKTRQEIIKLAFSIPTVTSPRYQREALSTICEIMIESGEEEQLAEAIKIATHLGPLFGEHLIIKIILTLIKTGNPENIERGITFFKEIALVEPEKFHSKIFPLRFLHPQFSKYIQPICKALIKTGTPNIEKAIQFANSCKVDGESESNNERYIMKRYAIQLAKEGKFEEAFQKANKVKGDDHSDTLSEIYACVIQTKDLTTTQSIQEAIQEIEEKLLVYKPPESCWSNSVWAQRWHSMNIKEYHSILTKTYTRIYRELLCSDNPIKVEYALACFESKKVGVQDNQISWDELMSHENYQFISPALLRMGKYEIKFQLNKGGVFAKY